MHRNIGIPHVAFVLTLLFLPACSGPSIKFPKPEKIDAPQLNIANETPSSQTVISEVQTVVDTFYKELFPHLTKLSEVSSCEGCDEMRVAVTNSMRGAQILYLRTQAAKRTIALSAPVTDKERKIVATGRQVVQDMETIARLTTTVLLDADAYIRAGIEWNLSQLIPQNEESMNKTLQQIEKAKARTIANGTQFYASLN